MESDGESSDRGSAEPAPSDDAPAARAGLDDELLEEGGGVPFADALDTGAPGAPDAALGDTAEGRPPVTGRQSEARSGVRPDALRDRGADYAAERDEPPRGGPTPSPDAE